MLKPSFVIAASLAAAVPHLAAAQPPGSDRIAAARAPANLAMWRLDCGEVRIGNLDLFSDAFLYVGKSKVLTDSCYLIRHGNRYLLWDTGLAGELTRRPAPASGGFQPVLRTTIVEQLRRIRVRPEQVTFVGISHYHDDHTGQAADFPGATLLVGQEDWEAIRARPESAARFRPWIERNGRVEPLAGDHDVFGDGSVVVLDLPGHTPGHHGLLVRLPQMGPVLLTGDLYHFHENVTNRGVPSFNTNRADTLASMDRFHQIARSLGATIIIQHEPLDVARLPAFPEAAR